MAGFVQIIEFTTTRVDELEALATDAQTRLEGDSAPWRFTLTADRDHPGRYLNIVEFDSYEQAMENSARPEIGEFAAQMAKLCDGPPTFHNLDVIRSR